MHNILRKEMKLSASPLAYIFICFGLMFFLPGYPILSGEFFVTLGIYQSFMYAREANDILFSVLLPVDRKNIVKGKFIFSSIIELCAFVIMSVAVIVRMAVMTETGAYVNNALMNANLFALGMALLLFGLFNIIFIGGFFRTAYKTGKPFIIYIVVCFVIICIAETLHYIPGLHWINAFGTEYLGIQCLCLIMGAICYMALTLIAYRKSCSSFKRIDL